MSDAERGFETDLNNATQNNPAPNSFGQPDGDIARPGGINQGADAPLTTEEEEAVRQRRRALGDAVDDNAASHQGGMGAQSGQADFGSAGNLSGGFDGQGR